MATRTMHGLWDGAADVAGGLGRTADRLWTAAGAVEHFGRAGLRGFRASVGHALDELDRLRARLADLGEAAAAMEGGSHA